MSENKEKKDTKLNVCSPELDATPEEKENFIKVLNYYITEESEG